MVDILIRDGIIISIDETRRIIGKGYVAIEVNKIVSVGKIEDLGKEKMYDIVIEEKGKARANT